MTSESASPPAKAATAERARVRSFSASGFSMRNSIPTQAPNSVVTVLLMKLMVR